MDQIHSTDLDIRPSYQMKNHEWLEDWLSSFGKAPEGGVRLGICTLDNPGYMITLNLEGTNLENTPYPGIPYSENNGCWIRCTREGNHFVGYSSPEGLIKCIAEFRRWAEARDSARETRLESRNELVWLQLWYHSQCDGDWEHTYGLDISFVDGQGWQVEIDIFDTEMHDVPYDGFGVTEEGNGGTWCRRQDMKFLGSSPLNNGLTTILNEFRRLSVRCVLA